MSYVWCVVLSLQAVFHSWHASKGRTLLHQSIESMATCKLLECYTSGYQVPSHEYLLMLTYVCTCMYVKAYPQASYFVIPAYF
jgi:hypothetical protein